LLVRQRAGIRQNRRTFARHTPVRKPALAGIWLTDVPEAGRRR
jgi:hypothetical protein